MRFIVLGSGAIGGTVGGRLAASGHDVVLIARGAHGVALREHGLRIESPEGISTVAPQVCEHPAQVSWREDDVVLLAVKTQDAAAALRDLATTAPASTAVACLTNGLEAERLALRHFEQVLAVSVFAPTTFLEPGVVQVWAAPIPGALEVGRYPHGEDPLAGELATAWSTAGFVAQAHPDVMRWKRGKLLMNLSNAAEALAGPSVRQSRIPAAARREGLDCYQAAGWSSTTEAEDAARWALVPARPIDGRTRGGGSTWQSLARGTGTVECDYLNGEIALLGRLHGVATPINARLQQLIRAAVRRGAAPGAMSVAELETRLEL